MPCKMSNILQGGTVKQVRINSGCPEPGNVEKSPAEASYLDRSKWRVKIAGSHSSYSQSLRLEAVEEVEISKLRTLPVII